MQECVVVELFGHVGKRQMSKQLMSVMKCCNYIYCWEVWCKIPYSC